MELLKRAAHWQFTCYKAAKKFRSHGFLHRISTTTKSLHHFHSYPSVTNCSLKGREGQTIVCDLHGSLLTTPSLFPFFMLVAFEGGSLFRAILLLLLSPLFWLLGQQREIAMRLMVFVTFCGLQKNRLDLVSRAVLPKFFLEKLHLQACNLFMATTGKRTVITTMPRIMVEGFLREFVGVTEVVGAELQVVRGRYFTGLISGSTVSSMQKAIKAAFEDAKADVGILNPNTNLHHHLLIPYCKEIYVVNKEDSNSETPRSRFPKPLIFHDGRLAFLPTPSATLALFMWLPVAIPLSIFRIAMGIVFPYKVAIFLAAVTGIRLRVGGLVHTASSSVETAPDVGRKGVLYVCTHRTLLDPVMLCTALQRPVPAVTYSLSRMSEMLAPMRTVRLTRDRERDAETMRRLLREGDLAVCPEGTTCREPYLLRFSSLFAELAEEIVPVAMDARVETFYGTTASGHKWLDPVVFMMDPTPAYTVDVLGRVPRDMTCAGGWNAAEVANRIQQQLAEALGFECTSLTRRDKYMILAGNEGVVKEHEQGEGKTKH
ncbi:glycerol-3-phosphate acyltransferase 1-like [Canna indica]|uniref:Glycerol-3-phosphate acyltransferase 1-like n=1 Tax=Canna indica TaxID=4628 RepID=A0AAQ3KQ20_9LILI|nr:glycerol-3-phosphate acyltransferase 1-like [Canna indica]